MAFTGFHPNALRFLQGLAEHNDRAWFHEHEAEYKGLLLDPARELVIALGERLAAVAPGIHADPRVNGSIMRIAPDTRFSHDQTPYKTPLDPWPGGGGGRGGGGRLGRRSGPARTCDQLAAAVRAGARHRLGAGRAEGALVAADARVSVAGEGSAAALADRTHLQGHAGTIRSRAMRV